ncbi:MAG TPA: GGDEF domain-containing protein [Thermoleophilaceae bacterium]|nr:GGDEF domain-containing protein [Thermoleophilaceae bacterium]
MERLSSFLCPTELDRTRVLEAGERVRGARKICAGVLLLAVVLVTPWTGFITFAVFAPVLLELATLEKRLQRSKHPEVVAARASLVALFFIGLGTALNGGLDSPSLSWMIVPVAIASTRFRWQVVLVGAVITGTAMLLATIPVDPGRVYANPEFLIANMALLGCVVAITSALMRGELTQRDRAVLDSLTGLLNRSALETRVAEIEQQARLTGGALSLVLCDIDRFKQVNDTYGHERGDAVLRDVAYGLRKSLRSFELAYRLGGEEFLVLMPGADLAEAAQVAERLRAGLAQAKPGGLALTMSVGVASASGDELRYDEVFREADAALFEAKRGGRDRVVVAGDEPALPEPAERHSPTETAAVQLT